MATKRKPYPQTNYAQLFSKEKLENIQKELGDKIQSNQDIKTKVNDEFDYDKSKKALNIKELEVKLEGLESFYNGRTFWNRILSTGILLSLAFQIFLVIIISFDVWSASKNLIEYRTLLIIIAGENFAQIIGLAIIAVKFYFPNARELDQI